MLAQPIAQLGQQGIVGHSRQVVDFNLVGKPLAACGPGTDKALLALSCPACHRHLGCHLITSIDHGIDRAIQKLPIKAKFVTRTEGF